MSNEYVRKLLYKAKEIKKDQLLIIVLSGVLLMIIALPANGDEKKSSERSLMPSSVNEKSESFGNDTDKDNLPRIQTRDDTTGDLSMEDVYICAMEDKVEKILSNIDQVGRAQVIITLKSSGEKIVEKDVPVTRSNTDEQDSQGGSRILNSIDSGEATVYETESGKSTPYVVKTTSPQVEGVLVVCEGAGRGNVSKNITDAIEVLFGIEPHKIIVVKMKTR